MRQFRHIAMMMGTWLLCLAAMSAQEHTAPTPEALADYFISKINPVDVIIIPSNYRTTAAYWGNESYIYWGQGGFSWAIAYIAGLFALAFTIALSLTYTEITSNLVASKTPCGDGAFIVNPVKFIETIQSKASG
jgi:serine protease AprX